MKNSSIISRTRWTVLILAAATTLSSVEAGKTPRPIRLFHRPQDQLRNHHRPTIKVTGIRKTGNLTEISCEFNARAGFVDRIELRVDGKIVSTKKFDGPVTKGAMRFKIDLSKSGAGKHKWQFRIYQGRRGYQTVHGESMKRTITN